MPSSIARHRLFVAVPLFCALVLCSLGGALLHADVAKPDRQSQVVSGGVARGAVDVMQDQSIHIREGRSMIWAQADVRMVIQEAELAVWNGAAEIVRSGSRVTIAAISTPVVVTEDAARLVVPVGTQWTGQLQEWEGGTRALLPVQYQRDHVQEVSALQASAESESLFDQTGAPALWPSVWMLPAAHSRAVQQAHRADISAVYEALRSRDDAGLRSLLSRDAVQQALQAPEAASALPRLLVEAGLQGKSALLLPYFVRDTQTWLIAAFHPQIRSYTLVAPPSVIVDASGMRAALDAFMMSDMLPDPVPPAAASAYAQLVAEQYDTLLTDESYRLQWLERTRQGFSLFARGAFADRVHRYTDLLLQIFVSLDDVLADHIRAYAADAEARILHSAAAQTEDQSVAMLPDSMQADAVAFSAHELRTAAESALREAGGMITAHTKIIPHEPDSVALQDVVFATARGDVVVSFVWYPSSMQVANIHLDHRTYPLAMPFVQFLDWLRSAEASDL